MTALYEIITTENVQDSRSQKGSIDLKYQEKDYEYETDDSKWDKDSEDEWLTVSIRYKEPDGSKSKLIERPVDGEEYTDQNSDNWLFASAVAEFGMILKNSEHQEDASLRQIKNLLKQADFDGDEYKEEFRDMVALLF